MCRVSAGKFPCVCNLFPFGGSSEKESGKKVKNNVCDHGLMDHSQNKF